MVLHGNQTKHKTWHSKISKAQFTTAGGIATFENANVPKQKLINEPNTNYCK